MRKFDTIFDLEKSIIHVAFSEMRFCVKVSVNLYNETDSWEFSMFLKPVSVCRNFAP